MPQSLHLIKATLLLVMLATSACQQARAAATVNSRFESPVDQQVKEFTDTDGPCHSARVQEAITLIYEDNDVAAAAVLALRCEALAATQANPFDKVIAARIKALIAMRVRDMVALKNAGETLVAQAPLPENVADGHFFIAFACVFSGDTPCARTHVESAKALFTQLKVADALDQLKPLEQTLIQLEAPVAGR